MVVEGEGDGINRVRQSGQRGDRAVLPEKSRVAEESRVGEVVLAAVGVAGDDAIIVDGLLPHRSVGLAGQRAEVADGVAVGGGRERQGESERRERKTKRKT